MADERLRTKLELKRLFTNLKRKGITDDMVSILIDVLWRDKYTLRTSGFSIAGGPDAVIAWDNATRTFSIEPYDPSYEGYVPRFAFYAWSRTADYQRKYEKEELELPDEEGLYVIYYASNDETRTQVLNYLKNPTSAQLKLFTKKRLSSP